MIDIVIPYKDNSEQLDKTVRLVEEHTSGYKLHLVREPNLNVSDARQKAMDEVVHGDIVCFLDDDSEMVHDGWLDAMARSLDANPDAGAVFGGEWWGTEKQTEVNPVAGDVEIDYGPAACMLIDKRRIPEQVKWDSNIGLCNGWLGGDFEEVDYCYQLSRAGLKLLRCTSALFHHTGGRTTLRDFGRSDRARTTRAMQILLNYKYAKAPEDADWFKGLKYAKASVTDDNMLAGGETLRGCYKDVIENNGLTGVPFFKRAGLI